MPTMSNPAPTEVDGPWYEWHTDSQIEDFLTEQDGHRLGRSDDVVVAVTAMVSRFARVHSVHRPEARLRMDGSFGTALLLAFPDDRFTWCTISPSITRRWRTATPPPHSDRLRLLGEVFASMYWHMPVGEFLADPERSAGAVSNLFITDQVEAVSNLFITDQIEAVINLWWNNRLAEGMSPETAQVMLGLLVPTNVWRLLDFSTHDHRAPVMKADEDPW